MILAYSPVRYRGGRRMVAGAAYAQALVGVSSAAGGGPTGQSPRPSRYRGGHRVNYYHPALLWAAWVTWRVFA